MTDRPEDAATVIAEALARTAMLRVPATLRRTNESRVSPLDREDAEAVLVALSEQGYEVKKRSRGVLSGISKIELVDRYEDLPGEVS